MAAGDAGSAAVLIPTVAALAARGFAAEVHASGPALAQWQKAEAADLRAHSEPVSEEEAEAALGGAAVLACGAGVFNSIEHAFRRAALARGVPSVSVVDFWGRIEERFSRVVGGDRERSPADVVCALDEANRDELLAAGFADDQVVITGSPHLEGVARFLSEARTARGRWRRDRGVAPEQQLVLFVSEPFDESDRHADGRARLGYDQASTLEAVLRAADEVAAADGLRTLVVARPHPRETGTALADVAGRWRSERVRVQVSADGDAREWVVAADVVTGMTSVVLIEAALARRPALSVQIGLRESGHPDPNLANALGLTRLVLDARTLADALRDAAAGRAVPADEARLGQLAGPGCAARVAEVVIERAGRGQGAPQDDRTPRSASCTCDSRACPRPTIRA